jgi:hypothetical protein
MSIVEAARVLQPPWPANLLEASRALLQATAPFFRSNPRSVALAHSVLERYPVHRARFSQAAELLGADPVDLALAALSYDLTLGRLGCSTAVLATPAGPVIARNLDWVPTDRIAQASCVTTTPGGLQAGFVGGVGVVTGLSRNGFAVVLNAVGCDQLDPAGYPVLLFLEHLIDQSRDFEEAVQRASVTPLMTSALLTLAGTRNHQRAVVERTPGTSAVRSARGDELLLTTNHYRALARPSWCDRYGCLEEKLARVRAKPTDEQLLECLTALPVYNPLTTQHVLLHPASQTLRLFVPGALLAGEADTSGGWLAGLLG